eukprot:scaffold33950_cov29-Tisochrysis_lutea.AAC.3
MCWVEVGRRDDLGERLHVGRLHVHDVEAGRVVIEIPHVEPQVVAGHERLAIRVQSNRVDVVRFGVAVTTRSRVVMSGSLKPWPAPHACAAFPELTVAPQEHLAAHGSAAPPGTRPAEMDKTRRAISARCAGHTALRHNADLFARVVQARLMQLIFSSISRDLR